MTSIYFNDIAITFSDDISKSSVNSINLKVTKSTDFELVAAKLQNDEYNSDLIISGYDKEKMFYDFCSLFIYIEAAGGVVINSNSMYLLIKRFGIWDLPKGKIESDETASDAAMREVCEETGLVRVEIGESLPDTFHIYNRKGRWFVKKTYWFLMKTSDSRNLVPQVEEEISDAVWMRKHEAERAISDSYRSIKEELGYLFEE